MVFVYYLDFFSFLSTIFKKEIYYIYCSSSTKYILNKLKIKKYKQLDVQEVIELSKMHITSNIETTNLILDNMTQLNELNLMKYLQKIINIDKHALFSTVIKSYTSIYLRDMIVFKNIVKYYLSEKKYKNKDVHVIFNHSNSTIENIISKNGFKYKISATFSLRRIIRFYLDIINAIFYIFQVKQQNVNLKNYKCTAELIDIDKFSNKPGEANFVEKLFNYNKNDILYYYFSKPKFAVDKYSNEQIMEFAKHHNINIINIDILKSQTIPKSFMYKEIIKIIFLDLKYFEKILYIKILLQWYGYNALFDNNKYIDNIVHVSFPTANSTWYWNSGLVTGIANNYNTSSIGYQTRIYYLDAFELTFDYYDTFYYMKGWKNCLEKYDIFIKNKKEINNHYLSEFTKKPNTHKVNNKDLVVTVFPTDLEIVHHYNYAYNKLFFKNVFKLLELDNNFKLYIKAKNISFINEYKEFNIYKEYVKKFENRIIFLSKSKDDIFDIIEQSDIIIAIGFTNPAIIAADLGKNVLIFENLGQYNKCMNKFNMKITNTSIEFQNEFQSFLKDI